MKRTTKKSPIKRYTSFLKQEWLNLGLIGFVLLLAAAIIPGSVRADDAPHPTEAEQRSTDLQIAAMNNTLTNFGTLPTAANRQATRTIKVTTTAYSSDVAQTDATPFVTASGTAVRHGVLAANFLPIGTKVKIPSLYGEEIFIVEDRMNARYWQRVDIWMGSRAQAEAFGVQRLEMEIYE